MILLRSPGTKTEKKQKSFLNRRSQRSQRVTVFKSHRRPRGPVLSESRSATNETPLYPHSSSCSEIVIVVVLDFYGRGKRADCRQRSVFNVQCSTFSVQRSTFSVQRSAFSVQRSAFSVQRSTFNVQRSAFSVQRSAFSVQRSTFNVQRSTFNVQRSAFNVQRSRTIRTIGRGPTPR